jgi:hypothetical protein
MTMREHHRAGGDEDRAREPLPWPGSRPILITGLPRSGTSWVGKMLEASGEVVYVNEPLNPQHPPGRSPGVLDARVTHRFQYISEENEEPWLAAFRDTVGLRYRLAAELRRNRGAYDLARAAKYFTAFTVGRARRRRALLDDPYAIFSSAWFAQRMGATTVILVRDPVSFVGSWANLGWTVYFHELLEQPLLVRDLLAEHADDLRRLVGSEDRVEKNAMLWRVTYSVIDRLQQAVPSLHVRRYEDLTTDPASAFAELYRLCGLTWTEQTAAVVADATTAGGTPARSFAWSRTGGLSRTAFQPMDSRTGLTSFRERLAPADIERVRAITGDVAARWYSPDTRSSAGC